MIPFELFAARHGAQPCSEFLRASPHPYLLALLLDADVDPHAQTTPPALLQQLELEPTPGRLWVLPVAARVGARPSAGLITVGRGPDNDLVIPAPSVSKLHAYLAQHDGAWTITDADSRNGTAVEGLKLLRQQPVRLRSGALVELSRGAVVLEFLEPAHLYERFAADADELAEHLASSSQRLGVQA